MDSDELLVLELSELGFHGASSVAEAVAGFSPEESFDRLMNLRVWVKTQSCLYSNQHPEMGLLEDVAAGVVVEVAETVEEQFESQQGPEISVLNVSGSD